MEATKPWWYLGGSVLFALLVCASAWYKENGLADVITLNQAIARLQAQGDDLEQENHRLKEELTRLAARDDWFVERVAREDLGLVRPGEVVYEFVDESKLRWSVRPGAEGPSPGG